MRPADRAPKKAAKSAPDTFPTGTLDDLTVRAGKAAKNKTKKERPLREPRTPSMRRFPQPGDQQPGNQQPPAPQPGMPQFRAAQAPPPPLRRRLRRAAPKPVQVEDPAVPGPKQIASRRPRPWIPILIFIVIFLGMVYGCVASTKPDHHGAERPTLVWQP